MIQSGGILGKLLVGIPYAMLHAEKETLRKRITLAKNEATGIAKEATEYYINKGINELDKKFTASKGSGITN